MNKNLKSLCAAIAISLLPVGATCYAANNVEERYETIWVEATQKPAEVNDAANKELSLEDAINLRSDKDKYNNCIGKDVVIKMNISKIHDKDNETSIMSKSGSLKAKCILDKDSKSECLKYKEGDEVIVKGKLKEIKGKKIILENAKVLKSTNAGKDKFNKDKFKNREEENKEEEKKTTFHKEPEEKPERPEKPEGPSKREDRKELKENKEEKRTNVEKKNEENEKKTNSEEKSEKQDKKTNSEKKNEEQDKKTNSEKKNEEQDKKTNSEKKSEEQDKKTNVEKKTEEQEKKTSTENKENENKKSNN
ncbi:hypothetical protein [Clostridium mediterraneense]|uniref:hypothetical protein n=1 Tax=Clostridium mediterraneense TaxID=1805472 RepID=UPI000834076A|nr:hypothetical protein [Clostridium mediterraneense]